MICSLGMVYSYSQSVEPSQKESSNFVGHWKGAIVLPGTELEIKIDLSNENGWNGTIDIPVQGLRGFKLDNIKTDEANISFILPNIPGNPTFSGKLNNNSIKGDFTQSGQKFKFFLNQAEREQRKAETPSKGLPGEGFAGIWQGSISLNGFEMRLVFNLSSENNEVKGTMSSIDQNANNIPISRGRSENNNLRIEIQSVGGVFTGKLSSDGSEIEGEWKQGGQKIPLKLLRLDQAPDLARPQDPKKPYPYSEEELVFLNPRANIELAGTLTIPKTKGPHPTVVLISGSGPQDRDESLMGHRPFLVLADHLTRNGIAVLRFDDRGTAKSQGDFSTALTTDFADDVLAAVEFLKTRDEVDSKQIGLVGHSEGGLIAPIVAADSEDIAFLVLLAGVGVPMDELLARQSADMMRVMGATPDIIKEQMAVQKRIFNLVLNNSEDSDLHESLRTIMKESLKDFTPEQIKAMGISEAHINSQIQVVTSPWFKKLLTIDPAPYLEKVDVPVLAINGTKDVQVAYKENLEGIETALKSGGNSNVKIKAFENLNHLFQKSKTGAVSEYGLIEETFNEDALNEVSNWIRRVVDLQ